MVKTYVTKMHQQTIIDWEQHTPDIKPIPSTYIENIITTILNQTFFKFNNYTYTQNHGITMGAPLSVKLTNITLHLHLLDILANYTGPSPSQLLRYIDDIFELFLGTDLELMNWFNHLNNGHPNIKFTIESSFIQIPDPDILIEELAKLCTNFINRFYPPLIINTAIDI